MGIIKDNDNYIRAYQLVAKIKKIQEEKLKLKKKKKKRPTARELSDRFYETMK